MVVNCRSCVATAFLVFATMLLIILAALVWFPPG